MERCRDEILKFVNISEEQRVFSIMICKTDCMMVCREHVALQLIVFEDFDCIHNEAYFTVNVKEKKKVVCTKYFKKHKKKHYKYFPHVFLYKKGWRKNMFVIVFLISIC